MQDVKSTFDIIIIGYGPVGATLANFLGQDGWHVAIVESAAEVFPIPRAVHLDDEAQRILQAAGVLDLVEHSFGGYPPDRQYINAKGNVFFETHLNTSKLFGFQGNMYFHQPTFEAGLRKGVDRFPNVEVLLNTRARALKQDDDGVEIHADHVDDGITKTIRAKFVIGCDGSRSFVRKSLEIGFHNLKFEQPWLVTDFYLKPGLTREDVGLPYAHQQFCDPAQPISFIPNGTQGHYRFEFMLPKGVTKAEAEQEAYVHKMLASVVDLDKINIVRGAVYTFHSLIAKCWRDGRIFIAGDAAHQMPPFAGQGMCSGLRDVQNLSWKLNLVLQEVADEALLDSYEAERKPHVTHMTKGTMFLGNLVQTQNPIRGWLRDLLFQTVFKIPALFDRIARFALRPPDLQTTLRGGANHNLVGTYFPQPEVTDGSGNVNLLDELLGSDFAILGLGHDPAPYFSNFQKGFPLRFIDIQPIAQSEFGIPTVRIHDHLGKLTAWFVEHNVEFVILRPDRFIFGAYKAETIYKAHRELSTQLMLQSKGTL